jgi:tetratricopeptide (TPR) repeat protein
VSVFPPRSLSRLLVGGFVALLLNSAYLACSSDISLFYLANVALHPILGLVLAGAVITRLSRGFRVTPLAAAAVAITGVAVLLGVGVLVFGATRPYRSLLHAHVATSVAGSAVLIVYLWRTTVRRSGRQVALARVAFVVAVIALFVAVAGRTARQARWQQAYRIENPAVVPAAMEHEGGGPDSPFFPSSADTNVRGIIPAEFFLTSQSCGRCHRDIYEEWNSSAHHFSSFNNQWYRKSIEYMQDVVGTRPSKWCAGCHDHAVFFNGRFDRPIREQIDTPEAQAGLACTSCHAITRVKSTMGQGDFDIAYPPLHELATSENPVLRTVHDTLLALDPRPHRDTFMKPFHREQTAEFCSTCHKVHLDGPVNAYRWFRGFNDYDNWQASGVSGQGARSFYYPPKAQRCADCHMPLVASNDPAAKNGVIRSHRFAAANTALPFVNGDRAQLEAVQKFLKDGQVTIDVFAITRTKGAAPVRSVEETAEPRLASTFAIGEESVAFGASQAFISPPAEVVGPFGTVPVSVRRGESVRLEVVVRTRKVGHFFPGGTVDAFDVWVELEAVDENGRTIFHSGALRGDSGPVDPGAHFYRSLLLDEHGNPINKRNAWAARSVAYVRLIPPGATDTVHYRVDIPPDAGSRIFVTAKLNHRKFAWWNTQWSYAGVRDPSQPHFALASGHDDGRWVFTGDTSDVSGPLKEIPRLPITEIARSQATLTVLPQDAALPAVASASDASARERWNDYGIGLLLQGDIKGAEAAFLKVTELDPAYADGWVNVGRARTQEGNMEGAMQVLEKALPLDPQLAKTHYFLAVALKALGRYDEAITHLQRAIHSYPRDRVVLNQLGRVLFLQRRYQEAIVEFKKVLKIDPEDLQAHYNLMLCYSGIGDTSRAEEERVLYMRFKADEASQAITGEYRRLNAEDNNERQQIHEHRSLAASRP